MGCMAEWIPGSASAIACNIRDGESFATVVQEITGEHRRQLPAPFYELAPDGRSALTLNFSRLWDVRPKTGYCGIPDPHANAATPDDDGIYHLDLGSGETSLLVSHGSTHEGSRQMYLIDVAETTKRE